MFEIMGQAVVFPDQVAQERGQHRMSSAMGWGEETREFA